MSPIKKRCRHKSFPNLVSPKPNLNLVSDKQDSEKISLCVLFLVVNMQTAPGQRATKIILTPFLEFMHS